MGGDAAPLAMPVDRRSLVVTAILLVPCAIVAGPGLDQGTVDAEVLAREQSLRRHHLDSGVEHFGDGIKGDHPVAVLAEHGVVPHCVFNRRAHEPAEQEIVRNLLDEQALAADAVKQLQQHRPHQLHRCNTRSSAFEIGLIYLSEPGSHLGQSCVEPATKWMQRVADEEKFLEPDGTEQGFIIAVGSTHPASFNLGCLPASSQIKTRRAGISRAY